MSKYQSKYTGQQVDNVVKKVLENDVGVKLYKHVIYFTASGTKISSNFEIISTNPEPFTYKNIPQRMFGEPRIEYNNYRHCIYMVAEATSMVYMVYSKDILEAPTYVNAGMYFVDTVIPLQ